MVRTYIHRTVFVSLSCHLRNSRIPRMGIINTIFPLIHVQRIKITEKNLAFGPRLVLYLITIRKCNPFSKVTSFEIR